MLCEVILMEMLRNNCCEEMLRNSTKYEANTARAKMLRINMGIFYAKAFSWSWGAL